jgi:hypothetical protein
MRHRKLAPVAAGVALLLAAAACSSSSDDNTVTSGAAAPKASGAALNLKGVCPATVVVQTDWYQEAEYGNLYQMLGPGTVIDKKKNTLTGPLIANGQDTGVKLQVRAGGPAIGFQTVSAQMYADKSITIGQVNTDEAVAASQSQPTIAVMAPFEISPLMILWDKDKHPGFNTIADIGQTDTKILYYQTDTYMQYLLGAGLVRSSQLDGSYDGTATRFITSKGEIANAGFATSEPYTFSHNSTGQKFNVDLQLINDTGYPSYSEALSIRTADKDKLAPCLQKLVPIMQQASVDYLTNPAPTVKLIIDATKTIGGDWVYDQGQADYAVSTLKRLGLVSNGPDKTLGNIQDDRMQRMIDILTPIFAAQRKTIKAGLKPSDLYTNEFVNPSIGLTSSAK